LLDLRWRVYRCGLPTSGATLAVVAKTPAQASTSDPALSYAQNQMGYYKGLSRRARFAHQAGEIMILLTAAATVIAAALHALAIVTASIAAVTLVLTGFRQVFGPSDNWVRTSRAQMALEHAIRRYELTPEDRRDAASQHQMMELVISICEKESGQWAVEQRRRAAGGVPGAGSAANSSDTS